MSPTRDVIIVGGGHNGLACAAYLAKQGLSVLVLEAMPSVGGAAVTEEPWPGYRVSSASYVISLMPPSIVKELDLGRYGYRVSLIDPDYYCPFPDGTSLTLWSDVRRSADEIGRFSRHDAEAYLAFDGYFERVAGLLRDLLEVVPPNIRLRELPSWLRFAARLRRWRNRDVVEAVRLFTMSAADFLEEWFEDERVKGALATQAVIGAWGGPMSPGSAYVMMHHWVGEVEGVSGAWGWVHGGMGALSRCLAQAAQAAGAEIRTDSEVDQVMVRSGRAIGVVLADGTELESGRVVSNAHPVTTYLELVGERHLPAEVVSDIRRYRSRSGSVKINLALDRLPEPTAWTGPVPGDPHRGLLAISPSIDYLERAWDDAKYGRTSAEPYVEAVIPTVYEPELAPQGRHLALCFTQFGPYELREGSWETERSVYGRRVIDLLTSYCPGFSDSVEHVEVLAPPDLEQRFGLVGGNIFHGEMTADQLFSLRPIPGYAGYRAPISGLYLCGSGTHPGGGVTGIAGRNCARVVLRDTRRDRYRRQF